MQVYVVFCTDFHGNIDLCVCVCVCVCVWERDTIFISVYLKENGVFVPGYMGLVLYTCI